MPTLETQSALDQIKEYYGRTLRRSSDLKTGACCSTDSLPEHVKRLLPLIEPEIIDKFYGCGSPIPPELSGRTVLDLGCGTGRDVYIVSSLVGADGTVIGVDMTEEQLAIARRHLESQTRRLGYDRPNVEFRQGYIENLGELGIADESIDVVISNCVINLSPEKRRVFSEILRVLKPGGELYFSDVFSDRRVPPELAADPVLHGECLGDKGRPCLKLGVECLDTLEQGLHEVDGRKLLRTDGTGGFSRTVSTPRLSWASAPAPSVSTPMRMA